MPISWSPLEEKEHKMTSNDTEGLGGAHAGEALRVTPPWVPAKS